MTDHRGEIITVLGSLSPEQVGFTLSHEHLLCDLWPLLFSYNGILDDEQLAAQELKQFRQAGGQTVVDCTSIGLGRQASALRRISRATGVNIIMGTGWYREKVYPGYVLQKSTHDLADFMVREIEDGAEGTDIRAGFIGEIGTERYHITPAQERVFRAAARAQRRTGVSIWTHTTHFGELALEQIALLTEEGVPAERIVISHMGDRPNVAYYRDIAEKGVFLSVDNIGYLGEGYPGDNVRIDNVMRLVSAGHLDQLMLSLDVCMKDHLSAYGGKGYAYLQQSFLPQLKAAGATDEQISQMTSLNPRRALARPQPVKKT